MIPDLISLGPVPINSFGLMIAAALIAGSFCLARSFEHFGYDPKYAETFVFVAGLSGLLGARIWYLGKNFDQFLSNPFSMLFSGAGFVFYGGFLFAMIAMYILCRRVKIPFYGYLDAAGPTMVLAYAIGRLGCQLSGDGDYGIYTDSIFGMSYLTGIVPTPPGVLAYPTPIFESFVCLLIAGILIKVEKIPWWSLPLRRFGLCISLMGIERFFVEFIRINPKVYWGYSEAQVISLALVLLGSLFILGIGRSIRVCSTNP